MCPQLLSDHVFSEKKPHEGKGVCLANFQDFFCSAARPAARRDCVSNRDIHSVAWAKCQWKQGCPVQGPSTNMKTESSTVYSAH